MILKYTTGRLPRNFIYFGVMLFGIGIWRMIVLDWKGILFFLISLPCLFIKSGIIIDIGSRRLKEYIGFLVFKRGGWEDISSLMNLEIIKTKETQSMSVLSITRIDTDEVYKLYMILPDKEIELLSGESDLILKAANEIAAGLHTTLLNRTVN